jgi:hypothetical protein
VSDEQTDTPMPTVTVPAQPEAVMAGVSQILTPTIMKCALGGWLIAIPGRGVAGLSSLEEAINFLEDQSFDIFKEPRRTIPTFLEKPREQIVEETPFYKRIPSTVQSIIGMAVAFLGVKALGY